MKLLRPARPLTLMVSLASGCADDPQTPVDGASNPTASGTPSSTATNSPTAGGGAGGSEPSATPIPTPTASAPGSGGGASGGTASGGAGSAGAGSGGAASNGGSSGEPTGGAAQGGASGTGGAEGGSAGSPIAGTGGGGGSAQENPEDFDEGFRAVAELVQTRCADVCHGGREGQEHLVDFSTASLSGFYETLTGPLDTSLCYGELPVVAGSVEESFILHVVQGPLEDPCVLPQMPAGCGEDPACLSAEEVAILETWIAAGAPRDR